MTYGTNTPQSAGTPDRPLREPANELPELVSRLVRDELKLARTEMRDKGRQFGTGAGILGGSGLVALYGIACLLACAIAAISITLPVWLAALIIGAAMLVIAGAAALIGRTRMKKSTPPLPEQAMSSVKADINEVKAKAHR